MIRINLLPQPQRAKISQAGKQLTMFVAVLAIFVLGAAFHQYRLQQKIQQLQYDQQEKIAKKNEFLDQVGRVNELQKRLEETQDKIQIIQSIRRKQARPIRYLDELVNYLPREKIWFESLHLDPQGTILLEGIALDNQVFASYVQRLRNSPFIHDILLRQTSRKMINGLGLVAFNCQIESAKQEQGIH